MPSHIRGRRWAILLAASALALAAGQAHGADAPPYAVLLDLAKARAPRLAEAQADVAEAQGLARQAATRPNPTVALEVENFAGSGPFEGFDGAETTASISQVLELGGKRSARIATGEARIGAAMAREAETEIEFAAALALAYAEAEAALLKVAQRQDLAAAAETDARATRELVDAGREAEIRATLSAADLQGARADLEDARAGAAMALSRLSSLAGADAPFDGVSESLLARPLPAATASEAPSVAAARADVVAADARQRQERTRATPDISVNAGFRRLEGDRANALIAGVSAPLPLFDKNQGATAAAQAERARAQARLAQAERNSASDLASAQAQARGASLRLQAATAGETAAAEAYRMARLGYDAGRLPLVDLTNARRAVAEAGLRTLEARLSRARAAVEIARLTGRIPFGG